MEPVPEGNWKLTPVQRRLGALALGLYTDHTWIHRCVEKAVFVDPVTVRRTKSFDFTIPHSYESPLPLINGRRPYFVPLGMVSKWRMVNVDLRDEAGAALPLLHRRQHAPMAAAMLIALGYLARGRQIPVSALATEMPVELERDCARIAFRRQERALTTCEELMLCRETTTDFEERTTAEADCEREWREALAIDPVFMGLAWTLARGFLLMVPLYEAPGERRIVKFSYDAYRYRPKSVWRVSEPVGRLLDLWHPLSEKQKQGQSPRALEDAQPDTGRLLLRAVLQASDSKTLSEPTRPSKVEFELNPSDGGDAIHEVVEGSECMVTNLAPGEWRVRQREVDGYWGPFAPDGAIRAQLATVELGVTKIVEFVNKEEPKWIPFPRFPIENAKGWRVLWLLEEIGLMSRSAMFGVRLNAGSSNHFEVEVPEGFVITRIKLSIAGSGGTIMDMSAKSSQHAHVYTFQVDRPTRAVALVNIRPRSDTIVNLSFAVSVITAVMLVIYAYWHFNRVGTHSTVGTLFLASPGALAAFASQVPPKVIVSRMTAGLRLFALLPGLIAFIAAGATAAWPGGVDGRWIPVVLAVLAFLTMMVWWCIHKVTRNPPERRADMQGPRDRGSPPAVSHNAAEGAGIAVELKAVAGDRVWQAYEVRERLREAARGLPTDLRDEYLGEPYERPPSFFIESSEVTSTFVGLDPSHSGQLAKALQLWPDIAGTGES